MPDIHKEIVGLQAQGATAALATVVGVKGSTPRAEGAQMLIRADGSIAGSIGGGCIEAAVWQAGREVMKSKTARLQDYDLTGRQETPEGLICGGTMQVFVEPVSPASSPDVFAELARLKDAGEATALAAVVVPGETNLTLGARLLIKEDGSLAGSLSPLLDGAVRQAGLEVLQERAARLFSLGTCQVFAQPVFPQPTVFIFGAGHIGFAVSKIAHLAGFRVVVIDDRPAYASKERFPDAEEFYVEDPADAVAHLKLNRVSYAVIACRGHLEDQRVLAEVLKTKAGYIGMIGSRKKTKTVFANLVEAGVAPAALARIHAPIGLPIAVETPEEIAISIMAEVVDHRRQGKKVNRAPSEVHV